MDCFEFSLGVCSTELSDVAPFRGVECPVEDERLQKCVISDDSATLFNHQNPLGGLDALSENLNHDKFV